MLAGAVASRAGSKGADFGNLAGVGRATPMAGVLFLLAGAALAGIPPTNGFWGKFAVFSAGWRAHGTWGLLALAMAGGITLIYTARAYLRVWGPDLPLTIKSAGDRLWAPFLMVALCILLGVWPGPAWELADRTARWILDPTLYIQGVFP
jgi:formate hydrogenlyase subunit 3/multisubunit Na+/H+ antiporter MnhD subunit